MKTKLLAITALIAIGIIAGLTACDNGNSKPSHTHNFGTAWVKNATQHWHECSCGAKSDLANHTWDWVTTSPATETADGLETETCTICGQTNRTRPIDKLPHVHQWGAWVETTPATCTTAGEETTTCTLNPEHTDTRPITALGHDYEWVTTTPATCETAGLETNTCKHDSTHTNGTRTIPRKCEDHQHLGIGETCDCGANTCTCELQVYGSIDDEDTLLSQYHNSFNIYRNGDVTDEQMTTAVANVITAYNSLDYSSKGMLEGKIDEIQIVPESGENFRYLNKNGKLILELKFSLNEAQMRTRMRNIADGNLLPTVSP